MKEFIISDNEAGQRFDKYLGKLLKNATKGLVFKQLRNKNITLDGVKAKGNELLNKGSVVKIFMADDTIKKFMGDTVLENAVIGKQVDFPKLNVVYEDDNIIVADKPVGILSQKSGVHDISMNELLLDYMLKNGMDREVLHTFKPAFCNRLDINTSGLMLAGKTLLGLQVLSHIIKDRTIGKYYLAIVKGKLDKELKIEGYLKKDSKTNMVSITKEPVPEGDYTNTSLVPICFRDGKTLIKVHLITGKTHQIRAHLAYIGHPILGDNKYGDRALNKAMKVNKQLLHSYEVVFPREFPDNSGEFDKLFGRVIHSEYPKRFENIFEKAVIEKWQNQEA